MEPEYKAWRDHAENIGIQCLMCRRTHWNDHFSTLDPLKNEECTNCQLIKEQNILDKETKLHAEDKDSCIHPYTQPYPNEQ